MADLARLATLLLSKRIRSVTGVVRQKVRTRRYRSNAPAAIASFRAKHAGPLRLQVGASRTPLDGWLNTDLLPSTPDMIYLDITDPLPFSAYEVDLIMAEHVIEHVAKADCARFLAECRRCLTPDGVLRVSTPDLGYLAGLLTGTEGAAATQNLVARHQQLYRHGDRITACDFFNDVMRMWGHEYLYTEGELREMLARAGFEGVERHGYGTSVDSRLSGLERHQEGAEMGKLNLILEARPGARHA